MDGREGYVGHADLAVFGAWQPDCACDLGFRHQHVSDERGVDVGSPGEVDEALVDAGEASFSVTFVEEVFMRPFHWPNVKLLRSRL